MSSELVLLWSLITQLSDESIGLNVTRKVADAMLGVANDAYGEDFHDYLNDNLEESNQGIYLVVSYEDILAQLPEGEPVPARD